MNRKPNKATMIAAGSMGAAVLAMTAVVSMSNDTTDMRQDAPVASAPSPIPVEDSAPQSMSESPNSAVLTQIWLSGLWSDMNGRQQEAECWDNSLDQRRHVSYYANQKAFAGESRGTIRAFFRQECKAFNAQGQVGTAVSKPKR